LSAGFEAKADRFLRHLEPLQGALEGFCRHSVNEVASVSDVLQSAVALAFADFHLYAEGTNFRAWIFRYVQFEALNHNRRLRRQRTVELPANLLAPGESASEDERLFQALLDEPGEVLERCDEVLTAAIKTLSDEERDVLLLRAIGEFKYREIASILEIPVGSVMGYLARARQRLRRRLAVWIEERENDGAAESPPSE